MSDETSKIDLEKAGSENARFEDQAPAWGDSFERANTVSNMTIEEALERPVSPHSVSVTGRFTERLKQLLRNVALLSDPLAGSQDHREQQDLGGYPKLSEFLGSDDRWMIFRRFNQLQARLILEKQDDMRKIEEEILEMDQADSRIDESNNGPKKLLCMRHRQDPDAAAARRELIGRAETMFQEYSALLDAAQRLASLARPAGYEYNTVNKVVRHTKPLIRRELAYLDQRQDLISLQASTKSPSVRVLLERFFSHLTQVSWTQAYFQIEDFSGWLAAIALARNAAAAVVSALFVLIVPTMFVVPIYILSELENRMGASLVVLAAFTVALTLILNAGTPAKPYEILTASAAYLAVLTVFVGTVSNRSN